MNSTTGKLTDKDEMMARLWKWLPWLCFFLALLPAPTAFLVTFWTTSSPDSAAVFLALAVLALGLSGIVALTVLLVLLMFRRRWFQKLRDRLASDGITASEVRWFTCELTSAERNTLKGIQEHNPLLADAYCETLASRLTASRIIARIRNDRLKVEKQMNRARSLVGTDTSSLLEDLQADHQRLEALRADAAGRLAETKARLQMIEASATRDLGQKETDLMLLRLAESQQHLPLSLEISNLPSNIERSAKALKPTERNAKDQS